MSARGRGRGGDRGQQPGPPGGRGGGRGQQPGPPGGRGGGRGQQPGPPGGRGGGRGQQPAPHGGRGPGRGRGRGYGVPEAVSSPPSAPPPEPTPMASPAPATLSHEMEQKMTLQAPSASQSPAPATLSHEMEQKMTLQAPSASQSPAPSLPPASSRAVRNQTRPGYGKVGQKMIVRANHFLVSLADRDLTHYDVSITPEVSPKRVCRLIMNELVKSFESTHLGQRKLAYDGRKSCYTAGKLPFESKDFKVKLVEKDGGNRKDRDFNVSIKYASKADIYHLQQFLQGRQLDLPHETLQFLDVVLREKPSQSYQVIGRSFFHPSLGQKGELGNGLEYWKGYYQSLRPTQMGLSLNIDMSARAFFEPILVSEFVYKYFNKDLTRPLSDQDRIKMKKTLKGVKVETDHVGYLKRQKITGLSTEPIQKLMFQSEDAGRITVVQYFRQKYDIEVHYPFLPAVQVGSDAKPVYLPMEICRIAEGQRYTRKLNERQVTTLLRATCQRPRDREKDVLAVVRKNNYHGDRLVNQEFGMEVKLELASVEARVLPPPKLKYHDTGKEKVVNPSVGQWNMIDKKMVNGGQVDHWACVSFSRFNLDVNRFCSELIAMCSSKGMVFNPRPLVPFRTAHSGYIEKALSDIHAESLSGLKQTGKQLQLLIIILPDMSGSYGKIKRICETELGIVSQCCQPKQAAKYSKQYMENVALKINVKVGGRNTVLEQAFYGKMPYLNEHPTIIFGADVTHPQPGEDSGPSIAAVVASMDWPEVTKYRGLVSGQAHREEMIQDLYLLKQDPQKGLVHGGMIREHLIAFRRSTGHKPSRIIFYRDGVSEGQFSQVLFHEVDAIRKACVSLQEDYLPKITFVVVQKRHHTRLFPADHGNRRATDRSGNILPGTVVDTTICHPTEFDFYLCSHAGIQGTSRPTHYHVLYDENGFTADGLQVLTNSLCYTYARCTRSVSIVPPAYYAHLAAFRARYYIEGIETSDSGSTHGASRDQAKEVRSLPVIKDNVKDVMFYC